MAKINTKELGKDLQTLLQDKGIKINALDAKDTIDGLFSAITDYLVNGDTVDVYGFGKFEPKLRKARNGVNPSTGEKVVYPESKTATFKLAKRTKDAIKG